MTLMLLSLQSLLIAGTAFASVAIAQLDPALTGTWTTKSRKVLTGPGFYDPINDKFLEPDLTGFSYSFTDDGFYEEAYYRAISNPTTPSCPKGIMQFQHGKYETFDNGSLILTPFGVDGRQLLSDPCNNVDSVYTRYIQIEQFKKYEVLLDKFSNTQRLNLYAFDGAPLNPMHLAYQPPQMLPTQTLNPTSTATAGGAQPTGGGAKAKRNLEQDTQTPMNRYAPLPKTQRSNADLLWWFGASITALGGVGYFCF